MISVNLILCIVFVGVLATNCRYAPCAQCVDYWSLLQVNPCNATNTKVKFLYHEKNRGEILNPESKCFQKTTIVFIIHGYMGCAGIPWIRAIKNLLINDPDRDIGVVLVDWQESAASSTVFKSAGNMIAIADIIADELIDKFMWKKCKYKIDTQLKIIGLSLGGQMAGFISKRVQRYTGRKLSTIVALEPAGPAFDCFKPKSQRLHSEDAKNVIVIHAGSIAGQCPPLGTADIYVNDGKFDQPGCIKLFGTDTLSYNFIQRTTSIYTFNHLISIFNNLFDYVNCGHVYSGYALLEIFKKSVTAKRCIWSQFFRNKFDTRAILNINTILFDGCKLHGNYFADIGAKFTYMTPLKECPNKKARFALSDYLGDYCRPD